VQPASGSGEAQQQGAMLLNPSPIASGRLPGRRERGRGISLVHPRACREIDSGQATFDALLNGCAQWRGCPAAGILRFRVWRP